MSASNTLMGLHQDFATAIPKGYLEAQAVAYPNPQLVYFNRAFAATLNVHFPDSDEAKAALFSGQQLPEDAIPIAQAYAGHQFGQFNPQLGDGRAMILGDMPDANHVLHELDLKGSGPTPFSRGGDGKAALGPMLREVLISEAMHALGVPTTRSLAAVTTGEQVFRNPPQPGAVLARTARSHIRIGTFQFFAARRQFDVVNQLVEYCIRRHYPQLADSTQPALDLLYAVINAQAQLIAQWMGLGFIHGVMNTDNMLIGGETIDFGPCAFMDNYDPTTVFSSIDQHSRYAYFNQPGVAQWNLSRFAETLLPLIDDDHDRAVELATQAVQGFSDEYEQAFRFIMCNKLGLNPVADTTKIDGLIEQWNNLLKTHSVDWTKGHYSLTQYLNAHDEGLFALFPNKAEIDNWLAQRSTLTAPCLDAMEAKNPCVIPRNHLVEEALQEASLNNNLAPFEQLLAAIQQPFAWPDDSKFTQPASQAFTDGYTTFCGT